MNKPIICRDYLNKDALITVNGNVSYSGLLKQVQQFANLFSEKGYSKVAIYAENSPAWIAAFYSAIQNNCIAIPDRKSVV